MLEAVARAAKMMTLVGCINEPALLTAAGLAFALSSPSVAYGDLDGYFDLADDPSRQHFVLKEGWLIVCLRRPRAGLYGGVIGRQAYGR